jgi:hypothetical protein
VVNDIRAAFKDPNAWKNLETVGESYARYMGPEAFEAFATRIG